MGRIVSIVNRKGGVGKTTLTLGLADVMANPDDVRYRDPAGRNVVVVHLDPQASLTAALLRDPAAPEDGQHALMKRRLDDGFSLTQVLKDRMDKRRMAPYHSTHRNVGPAGQWTYAAF